MIPGGGLGRPFHFQPLRMALQIDKPARISPDKLLPLTVRAPDDAGLSRGIRFTTRVSP